MLVATMISRFGTQRHVRSFAPPPPRRAFVFARSASESGQTLLNRPFLPLAGATLASYASAGIGVFGAGLILSFVGFPRRSETGSGAADMLTRFGLTEPGVVLVLQVLALCMILGFPIKRAVHEQT